MPEEIIDPQPDTINPLTFDEQVLPIEKFSNRNGGTVLNSAFFQSPNFKSGSIGWSLDKSGNLEANAGTFRGRLKVSGLIIGVSTAESIQDAIDEVNAAGGGTVQLKSGTHTPGADITLYSNVNLEGLNKQSTIIDFENGAYGIKAVGSNAYIAGTLAVNNGATTVTGSGTTWTAAMVGRGIMIKGIVYTIASRTSDTEIAISLPFAHSNVSGESYVIATFLEAIQIRDLTIKNSTASAIKFQYTQEWFITNVPIQTSALAVDIDDCSNGTIDNVDAIYCTNAFDLDNHNFGVISECGLIDTQGNGVDLNSCFSMEIRTNFILSSTGDGIRLTSCETMVLSNMTIENSGGQGIEFVSGNSSIKVFAINSSYNTSDGIKLTATSDNITVVNNQFFSNGGYGWNIAAASCDDNYFIKNQFDSNTSGKYTDSGTGTFNDEEIEITIFKTADETVTDSSTLQNDDHLFFAGEANTDYMIDMLLFYNRTSADNENLRHNFSLPSGATYNALRVYAGATSNVSEAANDDLATNQNEEACATIRGVIKIGATAGTVNWKWALSGVTGTPSITVYKGSWLKYKKS